MTLRGIACLRTAPEATYLLYGHSDSTVRVSPAALAPPCHSTPGRCILSFKTRVKEPVSMGTVLWISRAAMSMKRFWLLPPPLLLLSKVPCTARTMTTTTTMTMMMRTVDHN